jgi:hypothetical protein
MIDRWPISRRVMLGALALAAVDAVPGAAAAQAVPESDKIKQAEAQYQYHPKGQQRCEICLQFDPPTRCKIVQGPISAQGWCQYFAARENAH